MEMETEKLWDREKKNTTVQLAKDSQIEEGKESKTHELAQIKRAEEQKKAKRFLKDYIKKVQKPKEVVDDEASDDDDAVIKISKRNPMNEFHDAYCAYMLLKVKIKYQVFQTAEELIRETKECIRKQDNLRSMIPEEPRQFMTVEKAFILKESMDAIDELVRENERNQTWLDNFLPKNNMELLNWMILVVKQLCYAGFPILALEVQ